MFILSPSASLEAATAAASDVTTTILAQRIELDNKNKTIEMFGTPDENGVPQSFHLYSMKQSIEEKFTLDVLKNCLC